METDRFSVDARQDAGETIIPLLTSSRSQVVDLDFDLTSDLMCRPEKDTQIG